MSQPCDQARYRSGEFSTWRVNRGAAAGLEFIHVTFEGPRPGAGAVSDAQTSRFRVPLLKPEADGKDADARKTELSRDSNFKRAQARASKLEM